MKDCRCRGNYIIFWFMFFFFFFSFCMFLLVDYDTWICWLHQMTLTCWKLWLAVFQVLINIEAGFSFQDLCNMNGIIITHFNAFFLHYDTRTVVSQFLLLNINLQTKNTLIIEEVYSNHIHSMNCIFAKLHVKKKSNWFRVISLTQISYSVSCFRYLLSSQWKVMINLFSEVIGFRRNP